MVERQVSDWLFRVGYHGNKGTYLYGWGAGPGGDQSAIYVPGASTVANTQERRLYQDFANIGLGRDGQQLQLQFAPGQRGKALRPRSLGADELHLVEAAGRLGWTNPFNRRFDYGLSAR